MPILNIPLDTLDLRKSDSIQEAELAPPNIPACTENAELSETPNTPRPPGVPFPQDGAKTIMGCSRFQWWWWGVLGWKRG